MKTVFALSALAMLAACASKPAPEPPSPPPAPSQEAMMQRLPAPAFPGASVRISAADAGKTIAVPVGAVFAVELVGVPTAGYVWAPAETPAFLTKVGETGGATIAAQNEPGYAGGNHWEVTAFRATAPGRGVLRLAQSRPWEKDQPPEDTFWVTIEAR